MKQQKRAFTFFLSLLMVITIMPNNRVVSKAAAKPKLAKKTVSIVIGGTSKIKVKNVPKKAKITYKSDKKNVAKVSKKGKVTGINNGKTKIKVSVVKKGRKATVLTCKVTVSKPTLSKKALSLEIGKSETLFVKNKPKNAKCTWKSGKPLVATVSKKGEVTALRKGIVTIRATIKTAKKAYRLVCKVTVNPTTGNTGDIGQITMPTSVPTSTPRHELENVPTSTPSQTPEDVPIYTEVPIPDKPSAEEYYNMYSEVVEVVDVGESDTVISEGETKPVLEERGFDDYPITYNYSMNGEFAGETAIKDDADDKHPMYQTTYVSKNGEVWTVYIINGEVFAYPVSFCLETGIEVHFLVSETESLTSYDSKTNKYYKNIPHESVGIVKTVDKINAETLDKLTIEELCNTCDMDVPKPMEKGDSGNEPTASQMGKPTSSAVDNTLSTDSLKAADTRRSDPFIVVSLGDSYSSGEGIEPFYGQDKPWNEKVRCNDWLAHRSEKSWPSLLEFPGIEKMMSKYRVEVDDDADDESYVPSKKDVQWYFGAVSGAETKHFSKENQVKSFYKNISSEVFAGGKPLPKQLDVFNKIKGDVDYVTLTIGGNDVGFAGIIEKCVRADAFLDYNKEDGLRLTLEDKLNNIDGTMENIKQTYKDIRKSAKSKATIIVAGYPELLNWKGGGVFITELEAALVNKSVYKFNEKIQQLVDLCRNMNSVGNIYYVNVQEIFKDHQAYTDEEWINGVIYGTKTEDLDATEMSSAYSIHPNAKGAEAYAKCVNAKILEIEKKKKFRVQGTVTSDDGSPLTDVVITFKDLNDQDVEDVKIYTNEEGYYTVRLHGGNYKVILEKEGFGTINSEFVCGAYIEGNDRNFTMSPVLIDEPQAGTVKQVSLGWQHNAAITQHGDLYLWGRNNCGQLGNGTKEDSLTPLKVMRDVEQVSLGGFHSAAITKDGELYMWGLNEDGQLGNGTTEDNLKPTKIMENVAQVSLGSVHSAAITKDGELYMWGSNWDGQLGNGTTEDNLKPTKIMENVAQVSLGSDYSAAITNNGALYLWGNNRWDQLGTGTLEDSLTPVKIMENVVQVSLGSAHSAAITQGGDLYMWGYNNCGQLGNGTMENGLTPSKVMEDVAQVSLGSCHSAAIAQDGTLYMWGDNYNGGLGDGTTENSLMPTKLLGDVAQISLGGFHSAAITRDGTLYHWGEYFDYILDYARPSIPEKIIIPPESELDKRSDAMRAYNEYLSSNYSDGEFFSIIDLGRDGVPELMCKAESRFSCDNVIFTYKDGQVAKVLWGNVPDSNSGVYWMEETGTFAFFLGGWQDSNTFLDAYKEFAYDGQKVGLIDDAWGRYNGENYVNGALNNKSISELEYISIKERIESGKILNYYRNTEEDRNSYLK